MNILLCNERFLFRFGVDRTLIILGRGLAARGHRVSVMANRFDSAAVGSFAANVITVPEGGDSHLNLNEFTAGWVAENWNALFDAADMPQVVVIGGWPFFAAIPIFKQAGCATVFMDCGSVPLEGFEDGARVVQEKLKALRRRYLPEVSCITAISRFIASTQSMSDAPGAEVKPILLGADHMSMGIWNSNSVSDYQREGYSQNALDAAIKGRHLIINLGRWELGCYKNSEAVYRIVDYLRQTDAQFVIAILADGRSAAIPDGYREHVLPIGYPSDEELQLWMERARLGISVSQWEGFNLPLVEMQWLERPVLALDVGAHPEVILHPWFLCHDEADLADKVATLLSGNGPTPENLSAARKRFRTVFRWDRVTDEYESLLTSLTWPLNGKWPRIVIDVSNAARDGANTGVVRVTRRLARELQRYCDPVFALWDAAAGTYVYPNEREYELLSAFNGPMIDERMSRSTIGSRTPVVADTVLSTAKSDWLLLTETVLETNGRAIRKFARRHGLRVAAVFYDAIPVLRPDLVKDDVIRANHASYMAGLAECDLVMPISEFSADCLKEFWVRNAEPATTVTPVLLPGEFGGVDRCHDVGVAATTAVSILCVSTLEPRKNHAALIDAAKRMAHRRPGLQWSLTLIGNRYAGGDDIARYVIDESAKDLRIRWLGIVDDVTLHRAYADCTFTVYASEIEGFGMPILESLWHGKPCVCHCAGVMAELAAEGGCLTTDVRDVDALSHALESLATDKALLARLMSEAVGRPLKSWSTYATEILQTVANAAKTLPRPIEGASPQTADKPADSGSSIVQLLYPACLTADWQMNDSERLAMTAILHRLQPTCAIEVGTYKGGSLSLLVQYAKAVFSIDIDPTIPGEVRAFWEREFSLTGRSGDVLPALLKELDAAGLPLEFVLIDGDHSAAGVRRDIEIMLDYAPKRPLVMMVHDGFNPECRKGMLAVEWARSPYVRCVDLDFIPGRLVEHGGGGDGEMWGGLALALLAPKLRTGPLVVGKSAERAFTEMKDRHYS